MTHYVLIFHSSRTLTPGELKQRADGITSWVRTVTAMGIVIDPRALGSTILSLSAPAGEVVSHEGSSDPTFGNLVFFDSASREQAIEVARSHPGLRFGSEVELREWAPPRAAVPKP